jgi:hypothetical protein
MPDYTRISARGGESRLSYYVVLLLMTLAAGAFAVMSFNNSQTDGIRAVLLYLTPAAWGFFGLVALAGQPEAFDRLSDVALPASGVIAGFVVGAALILDASLSLANLALGAEAAFILIMMLDTDPGRGSPLTRRQRSVGLAVMLMLTVISLMVAVAI